MQIINRKGTYNEVMFEEMAEFAQYQIKTSPFTHKVTLLVGNKEVATLEDLRMVYNRPDLCQVKARVSVADKHIKIDKKAKVKVVITNIAPNLEPSIEIDVTKWFEETEGLVENINDAPVYITPNKWIYFKGTR